MADASTDTETPVKTKAKARVKTAATPKEATPASTPKTIHQFKREDF